MLFRFCLYGFLKNQRYFEPFLMLALLAHDLSFFMIGLLYAARSLTQNVLEIPSGAIADSWGRRKCMIVSLSAYVISFLFFAFASHVVTLFIAMIVYGIGESFRTGTHKAMIFEWLRINGQQDEKTRVYGITRSWSKYGSALSALIAAAFVMLTGDYRSVFLFSIIPYVMNIVNFLGYPTALDGDHEKSKTIRGAAERMIATLNTSLRTKSLRQLLSESMAWEGYFHAIKDFLQPVLIVVATGMIFFGESGSKFWSPLVVGMVYTLLFLLSGVASRWSHRVVKRYGEENSAIRLWFVNAFLFAGLLVGSLQGLNIVVVIAFVAIIVLQNVWRPILISRFDSHSAADQGATVLSIESQAQRFATLLFAPFIGWLIDIHYVFGTGGPSISFWPIGAVGLVIALLVLTLKTRPKGSSAPSPTEQ